MTGDQRPHSGDIMISFLPLAHMLERCCEHGIYYSGAAVGFSSGSMRDLSNDLRSLKPTIMPAVPRLLNRVYDKYQNDVKNSSIRRMVYRLAIKSKETDLYRRILRKNSIWDKIIFRKIQECKFYYDDVLCTIQNVYLIRVNVLFKGDRQKQFSFVEAINKILAYRRSTLI